MVFLMAIAVVGLWYAQGVNSRMGFRYIFFFFHIQVCYPVTGLGKFLMLQTCMYFLLL